MSYTIDAVRRLVRVRGWGILTTSELRDSTSRLLAEPQFDGDYRCLTDFSAVTGSSVDQIETMLTARMILYNPGSRRAIFAPSDLAYGLSRAYAARADPGGEDVRVFRDLADAEAWLGL